MFWKEFPSPVHMEDKYVNHILPGYASSFSEENDQEERWYFSTKEKGLSVD